MPQERAATSMATHEDSSRQRQQPRMSKGMGKRFEKAEVCVLKRPLWDSRTRTRHCRRSMVGCAV